MWYTILTEKRGQGRDIDKVGVRFMRKVNLQGPQDIDHVARGVPGRNRVHRGAGVVQPGKAVHPSQPVDGSLLGNAEGSTWRAPVPSRNPRMGKWGSAKEPFSSSYSLNSGCYMFQWIPI